MKRNVFKLVLILITIVCAPQIIFAQQNKDSVLLTVADEKYTASELLSLYKRTGLNTTAFDKKDFKEYLDLFINYRMKIQEAEFLKLDTMPYFKNEYLGYYETLTTPYLIDSASLNAFATQAYERFKRSVRASHIFFKTSLFSSVSDTLKAYNKALAARERLLKGESFEKLALEISEDTTKNEYIHPETRETVKGNKGDLGYFTVFDMYYTIEDACYKMAIGEISMPIKTIDGYHIIKKTGDVKIPGQMALKHIWVFNDLGNDTTASYNKIMSAYNNLLKGESFGEVALRISDDARTANEGGTLPLLRPNQMIPEYLENAVTLKEGEFSKPFRTDYGYHILLLTDVQPMSEFSLMHKNLVSSIRTSTRFSSLNESFVRKVGKEYGFHEFPKEKELVKTLLDDSIFAGTWDYPHDKPLSEVLFILDSKKYTQRDFADYLKSIQQEKYYPIDVNIYFEIKYREFLFETAKKVELSHLEQKYPDLGKMLLNYREGLLIYDINEKMIWNKSFIDTVGLENFYEKTKNNHITKSTSSEENYYMWGERIDATIWQIRNTSISPDKAIKIIEKGAKKQLADSEIFSLLEKAANKKTYTNTDVEYKWGKFEKNDLEVLKEIEWKEGVSKVIQEKDFYQILYVHKTLPSELKTLNEARGYYTNNYQDYLEKEWIESLRKKYSYTINNQLLDSIK